MDFSREKKFVERWRRIVIPWRAKTDAEAVRDMEGVCIGMVMLMLLYVGSNEFDSAWKAGAAMFAVMIGAVAGWLGLKTRAIARLFSLAGPQSFPDLEEKLLEDHCNAIRSHDRVRPAT